MGYAEGVAQAMELGNSERAASSARAEADSLQRKVWRLQRELREVQAEAAELNRLMWKTAGEREGFKSLLVGFSESAEKMLLPAQKNELYKNSILRARDYLNSQVKEKQRVHVVTSWTQADFSWGEEFPLVEFGHYGMEPIAPKPPEEMETITQKLLGFIPYRMYFVGHQGFHKKKNAQKVIDSLQEEYASQMEKYKLTHNQWSAHKSSYENQQAKIKEYDLA